MLWWERRHIAVQVGVVLPLAVVLMWVVHVTLLGQPMGRGAGYGLFWGVIVAFVIVGATRSERARRDSTPPPPPPPPPPERTRGRMRL